MAGFEIRFYQNTEKTSWFSSTVKDRHFLVVIDNCHARLKRGYYLYGLYLWDSAEIWGENAAVAAKELALSCEAAIQCPSSIVKLTLHPSD